MKKLLWKILAVLVGLLVVLFLARNFIARLSVEYGAKKITGFPLTIGSIDLGLFSSKVDVHDLKLMNPSEFSERTFVDMPQLYIDYRLGSMMSGAPHVNEMRINIKQLIVVKNDKERRTRRSSRASFLPAKAPASTMWTACASTSARSLSRISAAPSRPSAMSP
jgi:hypothetical protein